MNSENDLAEAHAAEIDASLARENLRLTPLHRLQNLERRVADLQRLLAMRRVKPDAVSPRLQSDSE